MRYACPHCVSSRVAGTCCRCDGTRQVELHVVLDHGQHTWGYRGCRCAACIAAKSQLARVLLARRTVPPARRPH